MGRLRINNRCAPNKTIKIFVKSLFLIFLDILIIVALARISQYYFQQLIFNPGPNNIQYGL